MTGLAVGALLVAGCYQSHGRVVDRPPPPPVDLGTDRGRPSAGRPDAFLPPDAAPRPDRLDQGPDPGRDAQVPVAGPTLRIRLWSSVLAGFPELGSDPDAPRAGDVEVRVRFDETGREEVGRVDARGEVVIGEASLLGTDRLSVTAAWDRDGERRHAGLWSVPVAEVARLSANGWILDLTAEESSPESRIDYVVEDNPTGAEELFLVEGEVVERRFARRVQAPPRAPFWAGIAVPTPTSHRFAYQRVDSREERVLVRFDLGRDEVMAETTPVRLAALARAVSPDAECEVRAQVGSAPGLLTSGPAAPRCEAHESLAWPSLGGGPSATWLRVRRQPEQFRSAEIYWRQPPDEVLASPPGVFPAPLPEVRFAEDGDLIGFRSLAMMFDAAGPTPAQAHRQLRLDIGSAVWSYRLGSTLEERPPLPGDRDYEDFLPGNLTRIRVFYCLAEVTAGAVPFAEEMVRSCDVVVPVGALLRLR